MCGRNRLGGVSEATSVLVVDDEPLIRSGLRALIDAEPDLTVVGEAGDGAEVLPLVRRLRPDVVLMDVRMPGVDGIQATTAILDSVPQPPRIVVITTFEHDDHVYGALHAGATGFLLKRCRPEELAQAIRIAARGESLLFPTAIRRLAAPHRASRPQVELTEREAGVLRLVARGMSNSEIAAELFIGVQTVKTHVGNVLAKLQARDRTQAVVFAYESGFINVSDSR
ncbi:response regulator [Saccharopolyspora pogona]|uniref:response regulator n=1 Tax=Saccharopolyspora pogona TaxID=333966 RepID=UPI0016835A5A|nr:response regulator transcription factor [Saccharopolyspora pogona]